MNGNEPVKEDISEEVLNLLTEEERENLKNFNSKGIRIGDIVPTEEVELLEEASEEDESDIEDNSPIEDFEENVSIDTSSSTVSSSDSSNSDILKSTNKDFSDLFSDF